MDEEYILNYDGDLTAGGAITTNTTTNDNIVYGSDITYNSYSTPYGMDFKLPDVFLKVIKVMIPEIKNVIVCSSFLDVNSFGNIGDLTINLLIVLDESSSGDRNYEERIRDLYKMTFPDVDYVMINVNQIDSNSNKKFSEIIRLFGK